MPSGATLGPVVGSLSLKEWFQEVDPRAGRQETCIFTPALQLACGVTLGNSVPDAGISIPHW